MKQRGAACIAMFSKYSTSVHEVSHALVQAIFGIGPENVKIFEKEGRWDGQSLPCPDANESKKLARLLVSQLAGPIGQVVVAPESLGHLRPIFENHVLEPSISHLRDPERPLNQLGWEGDFTTSSLVTMAESVLPALKFQPFAKACYESGVFLFDAESAMFYGFRFENIGDVIVRLASTLMKCQSWDGNAFRVAAQSAFESPAWDSLKALPLKFCIHLTSKPATQA